MYLSSFFTLETGSGKQNAESLTRRFMRWINSAGELGGRKINKNRDCNPSLPVYECFVCLSFEHG
jgi:hypothetical protein